VTIRRTASILALVLLLAILARMAYTRGIGMRLGGPPAALEGAYSTEEAWIVGEIVRDVTEMSVYPAARAAASVTAADIAGTYRVSTGPSAADTVALDLRHDLWAPGEFSRVARAALGSRQAANTTVSPAMAAVHPALLDLTPAALVTAGASISRALTDSMLDAGAHEAAALTLGAFALRESAGRFKRHAMGDESYDRPPGHGRRGT
jgi:hypothetical protein